jgi:CubicO group peptidase (beta-lactamase class C family)
MMNGKEQGVVRWEKMNRVKTDKIRALLEGGVGEGVFPGGVLLVSEKGQVLFIEKAGYLSLIPDQKPMRKDTIFDQASLTKPLATTLALMKLVGEGDLELDQPLSRLIPTTIPSDKKDLTPRLLLSHSAGFTDWKPFYLDLMAYKAKERKRILREQILKDPLAYTPGEEYLYSDLGFMILEWIIEETTGMTMRKFVEQSFYQPLSLERTFLSTTHRSRPFKRELFAATEDCPWRKKLIQGEVDDENAWALGGYSGHAGLFGTAEEVCAVVNLLREHYLGKRDDYLKPETVRAFFTRQDLVKGSDWRLGWDSPSEENSSAGRYFSRNSVGHTGFTGTSVWMDLDREVVVILLTNRVHPTRENEKIKTFRPVLHDLIMKELGFG